MTISVTAWSAAEAIVAELIYALLAAGLSGRIDQSALEDITALLARKVQAAIDSELRKAAWGETLDVTISGIEECACPPVLRAPDRLGNN